MYTRDLLPSFAGVNTFARAPVGTIESLAPGAVAIAGIAHDGTSSSRQGVRQGPRGIREASVDFVYDLIRGCNPAPGAWTMLGERKLYLFDARKVVAPSFGTVRGRKIGEVVSVSEAGMKILAQGGFVEVSRVRLDDGAKIKSTEAGVAEGTILGG